MSRRRLYWLLGSGIIVLAGTILLVGSWSDPGPAVGAGAESLYPVWTEVTLRVVDGGSGRPIEGADVYVGWSREVEDEDWRVGTRLRDPNYRFLWSSVRSWYHRTDAGGTATVGALTKNCNFTTAAEEASGTGPDWLDGWPGVSIRVEASGYETRVFRDVTQPRRERRDGRTGPTTVVLDLGAVALTKRAL